MPWYDFRCNECYQQFEEKRSFARASDSATCPSCYSRSTQKLLASANIIGRPALESVSAPMNRKGAGGCGCGACGCN